MSTKMSIKHRMPTEDAPGYHLYEDCIDSWLGPDDAEPPVYLRFDGVHAELETTEVGATVTVILPRDIARELGLLPNTPKFEPYTQKSSRP